MRRALILDDCITYNGADVNAIASVELLDGEHFVIIEQLADDVSGDQVRIQLSGEELVALHDLLAADYGEE